MTNKGVSPFVRTIPLALLTPFRILLYLMQTVGIGMLCVSLWFFCLARPSDVAVGDGPDAPWGWKVFGLTFVLGFNAWIFAWIWESNRYARMLKEGTANITPDGIRQPAGGSSKPSV